MKLATQARKKEMRHTMRFPTFIELRPSTVAIACVSIMLWLSSGCTPLPVSPIVPVPEEPLEEQQEISRTAFLEAYEVFQHPRCKNCHPSGDSPLQFDDSVPHAMSVRRGEEGKGIVGMQCSACHQQDNWPGLNTPPGAPNWHLPPPDMLMVFEGKTPGELARQLKDPQQNGGHTLAEILHHVSADPLVLWGWDPGEGRSIPPLSHAEFVTLMESWIENGAVEPQ